MERGCLVFVPGTFKGMPARMNINDFAYGIIFV